MSTFFSRIANSMETNSSSWVLSTAAALYWRVRGNAEQAINCLRHSLANAPRDMKVLPIFFFKLGNIYFLFFTGHPSNFPGQHPSPRRRPQRRPRGHQHGAGDLAQVRRHPLHHGKHLRHQGIEFVTRVFVGRFQKNFTIRRTTSTWR